MKFYRCDKCGKEVEGRELNDVRISYCLARSETNSYGASKEYCSECFNEFKKYINGFDNNLIK